MAQARQADRGLPQSAFYLAAAAVAAIVLSTMLATGTLNLFGFQAPIVDRIQVDPAVFQAGQAWEQQRLAQAGQVDRVSQSGQQWERQRTQQGGYADRVSQSGLEWERQRTQQSGASE